MCSRLAGDASRAIELLERRSQPSGWDEETALIYAIALARAGRLADAIEAAEVAARAPSHDVRASQLLSDLHLRVGDVAAARRAAERAVADAPDDGRGYVALARVAEREGRPEERLALLERAAACFIKLDARGERPSSRGKLEGAEGSRDPSRDSLPPCWR